MGPCLFCILAGKSFSPFMCLIFFCNVNVLLIEFCVLRAGMYFLFCVLCTLTSLFLLEVTVILWLLFNF